MLQYTLIAIIGSLLSLFVKLIEELLSKKKRKEKTTEERISKLSNSLEEATKLINEIGKEMRSKHNILEKLKSDIEKYNKLADLEKSKAEAVTQLLREELQEGEKRSFWKSVAINFIFFVFGAVVSILLTKIF